jgi:inner membrane protein
VWQVAPELGVYWLAGYLSHLALDVLTTAGAPVFWPLPWRVSLLPVREGGRFDGALAGALVVVALAVGLARWWG